MCFTTNARMCERRWQGVLFEAQFWNARSMADSSTFGMERLRGCPFADRGPAMRYEVMGRRWKSEFL